MRTLLSIIFLLFINASANAEPYPWDLVKDARFNHAYKAALGPKAKEPWLAKLDGPSNEAKKVRVGGRDYLFVHSCKQRACDTHNVVLLYSTATGVVYGKISENRKTTFIGKPPADVKTELGKLYAKEFRR